MNKILVSLATAALLAATAASAQGTGQGPVAHACASEINQPKSGSSDFAS